MRLIFLVLLLGVIVNSASIKERVKDFFSGGIAEKLKNLAKEGIRKALDGTYLLKISDAFKKLGSAIKKRLTLSPERKAALLRALQRIRNITKDRKDGSADSIEEVNDKNKIGTVLFQSDIVLTEAQGKEIMDGFTGNRTKRQAFKDRNYPNTIWPGGVVSYDYALFLNPRVMEIFEKAAKAWESKTCLKFKKVNYGDTRELINVGALGGCFSSVGKTGKPQDLSLGDGCHTVGIAAHEIGHSLGLYHTMGRADRDKYITVNMDKIRPDYYPEFVTYTVDVDTYGVDYDYGSIMHYGATSSAIDRVSVTMLPTDEKYRETLGSPLISFLDYLVINRHYKCEAHCPKRLPCEAGGFPNPKNCNECVCPSGYGGAFCNDRPKGCGDKLKAEKEWKHLSMTLGDGKGGDKDDFDFCNYWIETQVGSKIEVEIVEISFGISSDGCILGGVEIKTHANQQRTGYRFCSYMDKGMNLVSGGSRVPIILYNRSPRVDVTIKYRIAQTQGSGSSGVSDLPGVTSFSGKSGSAGSAGTGGSGQQISNPAGGCQDLINCGTWKMLGWCRSKPQAEKEKCAKTCGLCW